MTEEQKAKYWAGRNNVVTIKQPDPKTGKIKDVKVKRPISQSAYNPVVGITTPTEVQSNPPGSRKLLRKAWRKDRKRAENE